VYQTLREHWDKRNKKEDYPRKTLPPSRLASLLDRRPLHLSMENITDLADHISTQGLTNRVCSYGQNKHTHNQRQYRNYSSAESGG